MHKEISPLDGRYYDRLGDLAEWFCEESLMRHRCIVELAWLEALAGTGRFFKLDATERAAICQAMESFNEADYQSIKRIEARTAHDVMACVEHLRERFPARAEWISFSFCAKTSSCSMYTAASSSPLAKNLSAACLRSAIVSSSAFSSSRRSMTSLFPPPSSLPDMGSRTASRP